MLWAPERAGFSSWKCAWELCSEERTKLVWLEIEGCWAVWKDSCTIQLTTAVSANSAVRSCQVGARGMLMTWLCLSGALLQAGSESAEHSRVPQGEIKAFVRPLLTWVSKILGVSSRHCIPRLQLFHGDRQNCKPFPKASTQLLPLTSTAFSLEACTCLHVQKCFPVFWNFLFFRSP